MIKRSILIFVIGNLFFLTICAITVYYGFICLQKFFTQWHLQYFEKLGILVGLGGLILFGLIILFLFQKGNIPKDYKEITSANYPTLFNLINDIQIQIHFSKPIRVFLTNNVSASVFLIPDIQSMLKRPERFLAIGSPLIEGLSKEELKAILLHEFAHITQNEINDTGRAFYIGLFAKSFLSERIEYNANKGPGNMTLSLMVFYYMFMDHLCRYIKRHYEILEDELEYEADDIAINHVDPQTLSDALLHIITLSGETSIPTSIKKRINRIGIDLPAEQEKNSKENFAKVCIRLAHRKHLFPWVDSTYSLLLNGKDIGEGNFIKGFTIERDVLPNVYTIEVSSYISTLESEPHTFEVDSGFSYHIELDYKYTLWKSKYTIYCKKMEIYNLN